MEYLTKLEFDELEFNNRYYRGRWGYFEKVIEMLKRYQFKSLIEIGAGAKDKLCRESITIDVRPTAEPDYCFDITRIPWVAGIPRVDCIVALQVWEHLGVRQERAFAELCKYSRRAIMSFPYLWQDIADPEHYNIGEATIARWTLNRKVIEKHLIGYRIIYLFDLEHEQEVVDEKEVTKLIKAELRELNRKLVRLKRFLMKGKKRDEA